VTRRFLVVKQVAQILNKTRREYAVLYIVWKNLEKSY